MKNISILFFCVLAIISCKKDDNPVAATIDYDKITAIKFAQHVQPLLNDKCATSGCHNSTDRAAGLSLSSWNAMVKGSAHGEVIIAHNAERSLLTTLFDGTSHRKTHPSISKTLTTPERNFLRRWLNEGAKNSNGISPFQNMAHKLYVPNQGEDVVAVIDTDSLVVARYVNVGVSPATDAPHFIVAHGNYWYVSLINTGKIQKFDAITDTLVATGSVVGAPALLEITPDGSKLYISQFTSSTKLISVMNTATMTVQKTIPVWTMPHGIRMNKAGTRLYVANMMSDNISVIDVATDSVIETIPLAFDANPFGPTKYAPMELAVSPNDSTVLVTCSEHQEVRMFSAATNTLIDSFQIGDQPWHLDFTPDGEYCYVTNRRGNSVSQIHLPMRTVMNTIVAPSDFDYPHGCVTSPDGKYIFVSNENTNHHFVPRYSLDFMGNICVINHLTNQIEKVLEVGKTPTGISVLH